MHSRATRLKLGRSRGPAPFALVVLAVCLAITALVTYGFHRSIRARDEVRFHNAIETVQDHVHARLDTYVALLLAARGLVHVQADLTADEFARFVRELEIDSRFPGIQGVGYTHRFTARERAEIEARMRAQGRTGFRVWPQEAGEERHAILFLEPLDRSNLAALGYDMSSEPTRAEAMARARDTGQPSVSGPVRLVQEIDDGRKLGFLVYVPVYGSAEPPSTVEERRRLLRGFVYCPLRVDDFLGAAVAAGPRTRVSFDVYDTEPTRENLLYRTIDPDDDEPRFRALTTLDLGGRTWLVESRSRPGLDIGSNRPFVGWVLGSGLLLSAIFFGLAQAHARKQEELRLQARVLESMGEGVSVSDERGVILYTNPAEDAMFGYEPGELVGQHVTVQNTYPPEENQRIVQGVIDELAANGTWTGEFSNIKKDGTPFTTLARITRLEVGRTTYLLCVQEDVTLRRRAERERSELLEREQSLRVQAEAASRAKDEFLAVLGHELRNPLSPIVSGIELMRRRGVKGVDRELELVERQVRHMVRLVDDLLDVSRIARGKIRIDKRPIELSRVVSDAIEIASPLLEQSEHTLVLDVPEEGLLVDVDEGRLAQVIANLLTNAAKFTDRRGRIEIVARREDDRIAVSVRDNGRGISADMLPRIFELFAQGRIGATPGAPGGLGIGLTLVQTLVSMHDGDVTAHSEGPGRGAEFTVRLPPSSRPAAVQGEAPVTSADARPQRILVVDDNADAADMLSELLRAKGHEVKVAYDGPQALAVAAGFDFQIGVFDIGLPAMDGYELAERMREQHRARLIAVTGYGQGQDVARAERAGFDRHFVKPVDIARLLSAIDSLSSAA